MLSLIVSSLCLTMAYFVAPSHFLLIIKLEGHIGLKLNNTHVKMPRPGTRSYECMRRSWHTDHHQPIRGSIIQQIFRVVNDNHSNGTKKNREWQQKMPLVVFKSEEIMYSKANSEAEYIDPETLWDRLNDAINTIIKKDDSMEADEFLPPCVEAALNLGCVAVKTSRSQTNNTRSYLTAQNQNPAPKHMPNLNLTNIERPNTVHKTHMLSESNMDQRKHYPIITPRMSFYPASVETFPKQSSSVDSKASLATFVYPLYYGIQFQPHNPRVYQTTDQSSRTIIVGTPVYEATHEPLRTPIMNNSENLSTNTTDKEPQPPLVECDLSLRLGLISSREDGLTLVNEVDMGQNKKSSFFPLNSEGEKFQNLVADVRKRKAVPVNNIVVDDGKLLLPSETEFNQKRRFL